LVIHTTILRETGERKITEIAFVTGRVESGRAETEPLFTYISGGTKNRLQSGHYEVGLGDPERIFERRRL
jgi:hypothetical protein